MKEIAPVEGTNVGERIKKARKCFNLTQKEFASRIGYHVNQVHCVESGKVKPSNEFLYKVAREFNLSYKWLMTGEGKMMGFQELTVTDKLLDWLNEHPDIICQLYQRSGIG